MAAAQGAGSAFQATNSVGSGYVQAKSMRDQADYKTKVNELNNKTLDYQAGQAEEQATDAEMRGKQAANAQAQKERLQVGAIKAAVAGDGGDVTSDATQNSIIQAETISASDQAALKVNAWREAYGFKTQANSIRAQQVNNNLETKTAVNSLNYGAKTSIIKGWTDAAAQGANSAAGYSKNSKSKTGKGAS